jgi:hypothetical protein
MLWSQFSAIFAYFRRKNGVFLKIQCYDKKLQNLALFRVKNANCFGENILKIITSVPGHPAWRYSQCTQVLEKTFILSGMKNVAMSSRLKRIHPFRGLKCWVRKITHEHLFYMTVPPWLRALHSVTGLYVQRDTRRYRSDELTIPGSNPTIVICDASAVNIYNAAYSLGHF